MRIGVTMLTSLSVNASASVRRAEEMKRFQQGVAPYVAQGATKVNGDVSTKKKNIIILAVFIGLASAILAEQTNVLSRENYPSGEVKTVIIQITPTNSVEREYYESGQLRWEIPFATNGKKNGIGKFYYPNGQLESVWEYEDNRNKPLKKYTETGRRKLFVKTRWHLGKITHKIGNLFVPPSP